MIDLEDNLRNTPNVKGETDPQFYSKKYKTCRLSNQSCSCESQNTGNSLSDYFTAFCRVYIASAIEYAGENIHSV